ncbi:hypothetical protein KY290_027938 [Solanum tuberosum]|uniref:DDE Tnp4 domain-containing protein n=1 Tax=Solanum tuberosum TaxID=4113 RepID=A0ABQ7UGG2_SOLTU|nr:hypothetical protein KY290_027938 [Solanum tuberosum]
MNTKDVLKKLFIYSVLCQWKVKAEFLLPSAQSNIICSSPKGVIMDLQPLSAIEYIILMEILFQQVLVLLICLFMASYGHSLRRRCQNRREVRYRMSVRVPKIISHLHYIINDNGSVCIDKLRMDRNAFHTLVLLTKDIGGLTDSRSMSSSEKLAMFLNILAHHEKNRSIKVDYIRSGWSVSQAFNECLSAILKLAPLLLVNPKPVLEDEVEDRWKWFEGCLGALDGTYIPIRVPIQHKPRYRTRKGEIATNVLGVCDRNLSFTYVLPGWEGSTADGRVLRDAIVQRNGLKIHEGNYYLCDEGYTNGK